MRATLKVLENPESLPPPHPLISFPLLLFLGGKCQVSGTLTLLVIDSLVLFGFCEANDIIPSWLLMMLPSIDFFL